MMTTEDIDRCLIDQYAADLRGMTLEDAQSALDFAHQDLAEIEPWIEALTAYIRLGAPEISRSQG